MKFKQIFNEYVDVKDLHNNIKRIVKDYFNKQLKDPFGDYYLYYYDSTHNGKGYITIDKNIPGKDWQLAWNERLSKNKTFDQLFSLVLDICKKLPILDVNMTLNDFPRILYKKWDKSGGPSNTQKNKIYKDMPDKDGYIKVFMPYGPEGKGFYYNKVGK